MNTPKATGRTLSCHFLEGQPRATWPRTVAQDLKFAATRTLWPPLPPQHLQPHGLGQQPRMKCEQIR